MKKILYNKFLLSPIIVLLITLITFLFYGYSSGITGKTRKNGDGCNCHSNNPTTSVNVTISGPNTLQPGQKAAYRVSISGGPLVRAGTNIAASSGELSPVQGSGLQKMGDELTHVSPKAPSGGVVSFDFEFTAPNTQGTITLYANGNSVNFNGNSNGDQWNYAANYQVLVQTTSVEDEIPVTSFVLYQNYPNPFNPSTTISYKLNKSSLTSLKIFNMYGEEVTTLIEKFQNEGFYEVEFDASKFGLSSGTYFYVLKSGSEQSIKKFVYLK